MALQYSPKIVSDGLVMCLDPSLNKSYPATDLPVKNGLVMWMDAADDTTFSYSSGTTVSQWRDKSGFNYHMVPKSSGPTRNAFLNSRKVLAFTASQTIGNDTINLASSANTVFVVTRLTGTTNGRVLTCNLDSGGNNWLLGHHGGTSNAYYAEGWVYDSSGASTSFQIYMGDWSGSSTDLANFYINGTAYATNNTAASAGPNKLGINYYSIQTSTCEAAEIIVFNRVLSTAERRLVDTYLGQKWGISNTDRSIIDLSGNNNNGLFGDGTIANMPDYDFYNKGAFKFNGTSDFIQYPSLLNLGNVFTINFWIKPTSNTRQTIISNGYPYLANKGFFLTCPGNSSTDMFLSLGNDQKQVQSNTGAITTGVVQMVTAVANGAVGLMKLYVNGSEVSYAVQQNADISLQYDSGIFVTGKRDTNSTDYLFSNLYALQIYNKALSAAEVLQNYEAQKSKFANTIIQQGLVLNLDAGNPYSYGGSGTTIYDVSPTALSWTGSNVTYNSDPVKYFSYNGSNSWLQSSTSTAYDSQTITMECWCYPNTLSQEGFLFEKGQVNTQYSMFFESINATSFVFRTMGTVSNYNLTFNVNTYLTVSAWNHIVCTYNGSSKIAYVNGVQVASVAASGTLPTGQVNQYIGRHSGGYFFNGRIGESRVYNIALSAAQVLQNYNATKGRFGL
jgi:hypothetical protein